MRTRAASVGSHALPTRCNRGVARCPGVRITTGRRGAEEISPPEICRPSAGLAAGRLWPRWWSAVHAPALCRGCERRAVPTRRARRESPADMVRRSSTGPAAHPTRSIDAPGFLWIDLWTTWGDRPCPGAPRPVDKSPSRGRVGFLRGPTSCGLHSPHLNMGCCRRGDTPCQAGAGPRPLAGRQREQDGPRTDGDVARPPPADRARTREMSGPPQRVARVLYPRILVG